MIPLFDTLRVFGLRIFSRRSPFSPDRNHIHHFLLDLGLSHRITTLVCVFSNVVFIMLALGFRSIGTTYLMMLLFVTALLLTGIVYALRQRKRAALNKKSFDSELVKSEKLFSLVSEMINVE